MQGRGWSTAREGIKISKKRTDSVLPLSVAMKKFFKTQHHSADPPPSPPHHGPVSPEGAACDESDIGRCLDLGLGRGIDATNPKPWLNKTSFQVRRVVYDELIGTEEGGALNQYTNHVKSSVTLQKSMLSAVTQSKSPVRGGCRWRNSTMFDGNAQDSRQ